MQSKKLFLKGINQDDSFHLVDTNEYLNALNVRFATSENGKALRLENIEGNVVKNTTINSSGGNTTFTLPAGTNTTIGAVEDTPNKRVFFFNKNVNNNVREDGIYCYDADNGIVYTVLKSSQVENGLNFSNDIHSSAVVDNLLYWTDFVNPQRRINVEAGIKTNHPTYSTSESVYSTLVVGAITGGTTYTNGTYNNVPLTGGTGSGAQASIVVSGNKVTNVTITLAGSGYSAGDTLSAASANIGGTGSGFSFKNKGIADSVINLIRNQPWSPLFVEKKGDSVYVNNFIRTEAFQFAYRFVYRDGEVSTFSPLSDLINYNTKQEDDASPSKDYIEIKVPYDQKIEQDVIKIEIAARFVFGGKYFVIKTFSDISEFVSHNAGTAQLKFNFFNDAVGISVDDASAIKPFDFVPLKSFTLEAAKNRLFLGNNIDGYETPKSTSMSVSAYKASNVDVKGTWIEAIWRDPSTGVEGTVYFVYITDIALPGYYRTTPNTVDPPGTGAVDFNTLTRFASDYDAMKTYVEITFGPNRGQTELLSAFGIAEVSLTNAPQNIGLAGTRVFKSDSSYKAGIVFYDYAGRKCGVVTNDIVVNNVPKLKVTTADRPYTVTEYTSEIRWTLTNDNPTVEIPEWAHYYSPVLTKSLRTNFFIQLRADGYKWVSKETTGEYKIEDTYTAERVGLAIDVKSMFGLGLGYQYQEGDLIKLYFSGGTKVTLPVKDNFGSYVICDNYDVPASSTILYEIYTPYLQSVNEPFYERAQTFPVSNPGKPNRTFSVIAGAFKGDVVIINRPSNVLVEAMSPQDANWQRWNTNAGRVNSIVEAKQAHKKTNICWSNVILLGTSVNGLSTFESLNQEQLPYEMASIQKLYLVSKAETEGTIMLAIGEQETASIYLGETQVFDNTGSSFLAKSSGVIGNINILRGSYGTINPESVARFQGQVFWFDAIKGSVISYSSNGLFPISNNKMLKYFRKIGQDVLSLGLKFYGGFDPYHNEVLMFAPRKSALPSGARLTDMQLASNSYSFTTASAPSTVTIVGQASYTYSGSPIGPNQATVTGSTGAVTYSYTGTGSTSYGPSATRPTQSGTYSVTATVASDGVYDAATSAPFAFTIQSAFVFLADYILLTYQFTDGLDLDTRTRIVSPDIGQDAQSKYIGWAVQGVWPTTGTPILDWGGDNTGTGYEAVLINLTQLKASYPSISDMIIDMRAFWYNQAGVNPVVVQATLWKGGTPIEQGSGGSPAYSFTNPTATGTLVINSVGKVITSDGSPNKSQSSGQRVATLSYNVVSGSGSFNTNDTTTPSV